MLALKTSIAARISHLDNLVKQSYEEMSNGTFNDDPGFGNIEL